MRLWSYIIVNLIRPIVLLSWGWLFRMEFHGVENVPLTGSVILTPNHVSYLDPILTGIAVKRRLYFMTWDRLFRVPVLSQAMRIFGAFPVKLEGHDLTAFKRTQQYMRAGQAVVIFPEGGRTTTGKLDPFKPGAFRMAARMGIPVVPVTINGAYKVWPPSQRWPRLSGKIVIYYHSPIYPSTDESIDLKARTQEVTDKARRSVASRLDPEMLPEDIENLHATT